MINQFTKCTYKLLFKLEKVEINEPDHLKNLTKTQATSTNLLLIQSGKIILLFELMQV